MRAGLLAIATATLLACDQKPQIEDAKKKVFDAAAASKQAKSEFDQVYRTDSDYDLAISAEDANDEEMKKHEAALNTMPTITVQGVTVGYEEQTTTNLGGRTYTKHYRATWCRNGRKIGVGYYSMEKIDAQAFAKLLEKLVPIVEKRL
jgi:outer membrane lipoprotein-sorting protein